MAATPTIFATARISGVGISTANTARDGSGTIGTVISGVAASTRIQEIVVKANGTTTAGMVRLFLYNGSTYFFVDEIPVSAVTASGSQAAFRASLFPQNLVLPDNTWSLRASTHNAESFTVLCYGADA